MTMKKRTNTPGWKTTLLRFCATAAVLLGLAACENGLLEDIQTDVEVATGSPRILVKFDGNAVSAGSSVALGQVREGYSGTYTFTVANAGVGTLELTGEPRVSITGTYADLFEVTSGPQSRISGSSSFLLDFTPAESTGSRSATVTILSDDPSAGEFSFEITGYVPWKMAEDNWANNDQFGRTVSTSFNGYAFVGTPWANSSQGEVYQYVYNYNTDAWEIAPTSIPVTGADGSADDYYGRAVEGKGSSFVAVGAPGHSSNTGKVYLYDWIGFKFDDQAALTASDGVSGDYFGTAVDYSLGTDADYVVVGAPGSADRPGTAYVYYEDDLKDRVWDSEAVLSPSDPQDGAMFGAGVAISDHLALIGAPRKNSNTGAVYAFTRTGANTWSESQIIVPAGLPAGASLGYRIETDGEKAVFASSVAATVYVYVYSAGTWSPAQILEDPSGSTASSFGSAIDMGGPDMGGDYLAIGAPQDNTAGTSAGKSYLYRWNGSRYEYVEEYTVDDLESYDHFGTAVGLTRDSTDEKNFIIVGARGDDRDDTVTDPNLGSGAAYALEF